MKAPDFTYYRPESLAEALDLLAPCENAKLLAGGQSLIPMLNMRYVIPDQVIDLNRVPGLDEIVIGAEALRVGALVRQRLLERDRNVAARAPIFAEALAQVGHHQTRNRGTIGGSLCHLDPAAELPILAALHDAVMHVAGPGGQRDVPMESWVAGFMTPALAPNEILTAITFPLWRDASGEAFLEFARRRGDFALAAVAVRVAVTGGRIARLAVALGGVAIAPIRLRQAEAALIGATPDQAAAEQLAAEVSTFDVMADAHVSASYRRTLAATLTRRAFALAVARASGARDVRN